MDCMWDGCPGLYNGTGGGGAIIDGAEQTVFNTSGLGSNALAPCPNNACSGFGTNIEGQTSYVQFTASAGSGPQGYRSIPEMSTYNYDNGRGQFLNAQQFQQQVIQSGIDSQRAALASLISSKSGQDYNAVYNELQDGKVVGSNANFQFVPSLDLSFLTDPSVSFNMRTFGAPSVHEHTNGPNGPTVHMDTASPYSYFGWGLLEHFFVDVLLGSINGNIPYLP